MPSWNLTVTNATSSSLTVKWSQFPLTNLFIQRFLVNYREHSSNVSLIFEVPNSYDTHYTGSVLKGYQLYDVQVIAVETSVGNSTYSSQKQSTRTIEGGMSMELNLMFICFLHILNVLGFINISRILCGVHEVLAATLVLSNSCSSGVEFLRTFLPFEKLVSVAATASRSKHLNTLRIKFLEQSYRVQYSPKIMRTKLFFASPSQQLLSVTCGSFALKFSRHENFFAVRN